MIKRFALSALPLVAFTFVGVPLAAAADKVEAVEKTVVDAWNRMKTFSADVEMTGAQPGEPTTGSFEFARKGDKTLFRMDLNMKIPGGEKDMTMTTLSDGEFIYTITKDMAMKMKFDRSQSHAPEETFTMLRKSYDLKMLADKSVDGHAVFVMEATPKPDAAGTGKIVTYFAKDIGVVLKTVTFDTAGKAISTMLFKNVKVNSKIDPSRFVFKAPDGVQVMDMTNQ